jgi:hypothetical protein
VAIPQKNRSGCWDCAVYVFVSDPSTSKLSPEDSCFQTMLHTLPSATSAMTSGLSHAQSLVDSSASLLCRAVQLLNSMDLLHRRQLPVPAR